MESQQHTDNGSDDSTCSPSLETPECDKMAVLASQVAQLEMVVVEFATAQELERKRNQWKAIATRLAQYVEPEIWEGVDAHDALEEFNNLSENAERTRAEINHL